MQLTLVAENSLFTYHCTVCDTHLIKIYLVNNFLENTMHSYSAKVQLTKISYLRQMERTQNFDEQNFDKLILGFKGFILKEKG